MNYLAHIYLSAGIDEILVGNISADFIGNKHMKTLTKQQINGVLLHRLIDAYTDIHPVVRKSTKRFRPIQGKYSPVVVDIVYDYLFAKAWDSFHPESLDIYKEQAYEQLLSLEDRFPDKAKKKIINMTKGDFISSYQSLDGLNYVFERMDQRTTFPSRFVDATEQVVEHEDDLMEHFMTFFPDMQMKAKAFLEGLSSVENLGDPPVFL